MKILLSAIILILLFASMRFATSAIERAASRKAVSPYRVKYIAKTVSLALLFVYTIVLISVLGVEFSQISIFLSSIFAVIGVALFAQWSILSNITASLIIFFGFPYRIGDHIRVVDKDGDISGIIEEISLFHVLIKQNDDLITYPNSLILQKAVIKLPETSHQESPTDKPAAE